MQRAGFGSTRLLAPLTQDEHAVPIGDIRSPDAHEIDSQCLSGNLDGQLAVLQAGVETLALHVAGLADCLPVHTAGLKAVENLKQDLAAGWWRGGEGRSG